MKFIIFSLALLFQNLVGEELEDFVFDGEAREPPVVTIDSGSLRGFWEESANGRKYAAFEGIPYAMPPVDKLRFKAPLPALSWKGMFNASGNQEPCLQYDPFFEEVTGTEDCLVINVYSPRLQPLAGLPVLVFIHGGAFMYGAGSYYSPQNIMDWEMVVVTFNYRVGPLGFLSTGDEVVPGNAGLKDQALALHWVKDNIMWFGGDPHSITLTGSSSGAVSLHYHYMSPLSKNTFHRGMAWSGSAFSPWAYTTKPLEKAKKLGELVGCPTTKTTQDLVDCLEDLPGNDIVKAVIQMFPWKTQLWSPFVPTTEPAGLEGAFLTQHPYEASKTGLHDIPLVASFTSEEGLYPAAAYQKDPDEYLPELEQRWEELAPHIFHFNDTLQPNLKYNVAAKIKERYLNGEPVSQMTFSKLVEALGDRNFVAGVGKMVEMHAATSSHPVHLYQYAFRGKRSFSFALSWNYKNFGVSHVDDLFHIFMVPLISSTDPEDLKMTKALLSMIYEYASGKNPTFPGAPKWEPIDKNNKNLNCMRVESPNTYKMESKTDLGHRSFWDGLGLNEDQNYRKSRNSFRRL